MNPERWKKIDELLDLALELDPVQRIAYLDVACAGDEVLRKEVEALLASEGKAKDFIETPIIKAAAGAVKETQTLFAAGRLMGHYKILSPLGVGGMGEVYLAKDMRLERKVALKLLPSDFTRDQERVRRFQQEARAASALNHPNIITVYEIGEIDGTHFIATEYIKGETLRQVIKAKRRKLNDVLDFAIQITGALSTAHEAGIIHRDIKPENIMLRQDGYVKVLDFGLAKARGRQGTITQCDTLTTAAGNNATVSESNGEEFFAAVETESGVVLGTVQYMSPEQARGEVVDQRTDIFSLGAVLYELATGTATFKGETVAVTYDAILNRVPAPLTKLNPKIPEELERIVNKALEKNRELRYQTTADLRADLKRLKRDTESQGDVSKPAARVAKPWWQRTGIGLTIIVALTILMSGMVYLWPPRPPSQRPPVPLNSVPLTSYQGQERVPVISPDGKQLAFMWNGEKGDNWDIYVKLLGTAAPPLRLTSSIGAELYPAWSPDGRQIAFVRQSATGSGIFIIPALGGPERQLKSIYADVTWGVGSLSFSPDGKLLAYADKNSAEGHNSIFLLSLESGETRRLTTPPGDSWGDWNPVFSPDGKSLAFARYRFVAIANIYLISTEGGEPRQLTFNHTAGAGLTWTGDGRDIIFATPRNGSGLWKVPISGGAPEWLGIGDSIHPNISPGGGQLAYVRSYADTNVWRLEGAPSSSGAHSSSVLIASSREDFGAQFSPDDKKIVFLSYRTGNAEIWVGDSLGGNLMQLTSLNSLDVGGVRWSPDGKEIVFNARINNDADIYVVGAEGGALRRLTYDSADDLAPSWSGDGKWVYFASLRSGDWQIWRASAAGGEAVQVTQRGGVEAFESPDGRWLYFDKYGASGIWKIPLEGGEEMPVPELAKASSWTVKTSGIYYTNPETKPRPTIEFYNFATRQVMRITEVEGVRARSALHLAASDLSISSEGKWMLYTKVEQNESDIMMVENYH